MWASMRSPSKLDGRDFWNICSSSIQLKHSWDWPAERPFLLATSVKTSQTHAGNTFPNGALAWHAESASPGMGWRTHRAEAVVITPVKSRRFPEAEPNPLQVRQGILNLHAYMPTPDSFMHFPACTASCAHPGDNDHVLH